MSNASSPLLKVAETWPGHIEVSFDGEVFTFDMGEKFAGGMTVFRDWTVCIDDHADYGDFMADPVAWVHSFYA